MTLPESYTINQQWEMVLDVEAALFWYQMEVDIRVTDHLYYTFQPPYTMHAPVVSHRASDETCLFKNQVTERNMYDNYQYLDYCKIDQLHDNCLEQET